MLIERFEAQFVTTHRGTFVISGMRALPLDPDERREFVARAHEIIERSAAIEASVMRWMLVAVPIGYLAVSAIFATLFPTIGQGGIIAGVAACLVAGGIGAFPSMLRQHKMAQLQRRIAARVARREALPADFIRARARGNPWQRAAELVATGVAIIGVGIVAVQYAGAVRGEGMFGGWDDAGLTQASFWLLVPPVMLAWLLHLIGRIRAARNDVAVGEFDKKVALAETLGGTRV